MTCGGVVGADAQKPAAAVATNELGMYPISDWNQVRASCARHNNRDLVLGRGVLLQLRMGGPTLSVHQLMHELVSVHELVPVHGPWLRLRWPQPDMG